MNIHCIIKEFDNLEKKGFTEYEFSSKLNSISPKENSNEHWIQRAESIAFDFMESESSEQSKWGTFFRPSLVFNNDDGSTSEYPSLSLIDLKIIEYWESRAMTSVNPILKARYSALVWDFKELVTNYKPKVVFLVTYINANIEIAEGDFYKHKVYVFHKLVSALKSSIKINNENLKLKCKETLIKYESNNAEDRFAGLWGYCFDNLINNNRIDLNQSEEKKIINDLEERLIRLTNIEDKDNLEPFVAEKIVNRLCQYYNRTNSKDQIKETLDKLEVALKTFMVGSSPLQKTLWLKILSDLYKQYSFKEENISILKYIRKEEKLIANEMKPIRAETTISNEDKRKFLEEITKGEISKIIERIAFGFIPNNKEAEEDVKTFSENYIQMHLPLQIHDEKGRTVSLIGPVEHDLEGRVVKLISDGLFINAIFLTWAIEEAIIKKDLSVENIMDLVSKSPVYESERLEIIRKGLELYFQKDYISTIHVLIPQIEQAIRNLLELSGEYIMKQSNNGSFDYRTLTSLLSSDNLKGIFGTDVVNFFKIILNDKRGWNLRNNISHGTISINFMTRIQADRIIQSILILGHIKPIKSN